MQKSTRLLSTLRSMLGISLLVCAARAADAHPLGNFTINHFARITVDAGQVRVHYVVDMAEIPAFEELRAMGAGSEGTPSTGAVEAYANRAATQYAEGLAVSVDGTRVPLQTSGSAATLPRGAGGLPTLRLEADFAGSIPSTVAGDAHRVHYEDVNHIGRVGWHELVAVPATGVSLYDSSAFGTAVTDEIRSYPPDLLSSPLDERSAEFSFTTRAVPAGSSALRTREGGVAAQERDRFVELIAVPALGSTAALLALLVAAVLGGLHALSPGHGKTVVGAYLVGARGTARHAFFLGLTVTVTHTLGVFALGLVTLFGSRYVVPERLFPVLSFVSGAIVVVIGLSLFVTRLRGSMGATGDHVHGDGDSHHHHHEHGAHPHDHAHLPPGADGTPITWRGLLALGVSGGILPCPSALVVLLSAIALHRVGFGLLLIVAFSAGLAGALIAVGLAFVYAGRAMKHAAFHSERLVRVLPVLSAAFITCAGGAVCYEALTQTGVNIALAWADLASSASVLGLGLVFGLKHALDADHLAAVSTIVSERRGVLRASLVGALWGAGHTVALLAAGVAVILLHVEIGERTASLLELCVAVMLIGLGGNALRKLARGGRIHAHTHAHGTRPHVHLHLHDGSPEPSPDTHHGLGLNLRPLFVGMIHGLAGSAALTLLVLSAIRTPMLQFAYIGVFGVGSIGGMLLMSVLVSLPAQVTARRFAHAHVAVRTLAAVFSVALGLFMAYEIGLAGGLLA